MAPRLVFFLLAYAILGTWLTASVPPLETLPLIPQPFKCRSDCQPFELSLRRRPSAATRISAFHRPCRATQTLRWPCGSSLLPACPIALLQIAQQLLDRHA